MSPILKKIFFLAVALPVLYSSPAAQSTAPHIQWAKSFGGSGIDVPSRIQITSDKGFIIAGASTSADGDVAGHHGTTDLNDYWLLKLDSSGNFQWQKSLGGSDDDLATSIKETSDGGFIIAGHSKSHDGDVSGGRNFSGDNYWIIRLDANRNILWQNTFGGNGDDAANDVEVTADSGFIVAGYSYSDDGDVPNHRGTTSSADFFILKLNNLGNMQWRRSFGGTGDDIPYGIRQTPDHGYAIAGYSNSIDGDVTGNHGGQDYWFVKIDSLGNLLWEKSFGGSSDDNALSFDLTTDHGFVLTGHSNSSDSDVTRNNGGADLWIVKLDSSGSLQWQHSFGGSDIDAGYSVKQTFDGGYITCGISASDDGDVSGNHGNNDCWVVKLDASGNLVWQESLGGPEEEFGASIVQTADSEYVIAGSSDGNGGDVSGNQGFEDYWIVKLGTKIVNDVPNKTPLSKPMNFPNPFSERTLIQFSSPVESQSELLIYDVIGQEVSRIKILPGTETITLDRGKLRAGVYIYRLVSEGVMIFEGRMVVR